MPMTIVVTRNVPDRFRGFLASCMCEIAPGVYTGPRMTAAVRKRIWRVLASWFESGDEQAVVMTWPDTRLAGGQRVRTLGVPRQYLHDHHGVYLARRGIDEATQAALEAELRGELGSSPRSV